MYTINQKYPEVNYGPLTVLIGKWEGNKGVDISPLPDGIEENPYFEVITYEEAGELKNAKSQVITMLRYLQVIYRKSNNQIFHDQTGYWMWDQSSGEVMQSLVIPRGLSLLAGGTASKENSDAHVEFNLSAEHDANDWGIVQSPFLHKNAKTMSYSIKLSVNGDSLNYHENTILDIYGKRFEHTDENTLTRVK